MTEQELDALVPAIRALAALDVDDDVYALTMSHRAWDALAASDHPGVTRKHTDSGATLLIDGVVILRDTSPEVFVHLTSSTPNDETKIVDSLPDACPTCSGPMHTGYGLAGSGMGPYALCLTCDDGPIFKLIDADDPEDE